MIPSILFFSVCMLMPLIFTEPKLGLSLLFKTLSRVDFPAPEPPIIPMSLPDSSLKLISLKPSLPPANLNSRFLATNETFALFVSLINELKISL